MEGDTCTWTCPVSLDCATGHAPRIERPKISSIENAELEILSTGKQTSSEAYGLL